MTANFTSVLRKDGLLPIAQTVQKKLGLNPGDQVRVSIKVLKPPAGQNDKARYAELLHEKDERVLTPVEQAELIALAHAEFDAAMAYARKLAQRQYPGLFDKRGKLLQRKAVTSLNTSRRQKSSAVKTTRRKK
ncbi:hypothetical protein HUU39_21030 [candidate division KSB1 bacterium]|nr:DUF1905 domain-containing protein [bacterium]NUM67719.1 hypothetical protein [candidate division KSB1 bacterium]